MAQIRIGSDVYEAQVSPALATLVDAVSASVTYSCEAPAGTLTSAAAWRVKRITVTGNVTQTQWADGGKFTQIADNRASLTYA